MVLIQTFKTTFIFNFFQHIFSNYGHVPQFYSNIPVNENEPDADLEYEEFEEIEYTKGTLNIGKMHELLERSNSLTEAFKERIANKYNV